MTGAEVIDTTAPGHFTELQIGSILIDPKNAVHNLVGQLIRLDHIIHSENYFNGANMNASKAVSHMATHHNGMEMAAQLNPEIVARYAQIAINEIDLSKVAMQIGAGIGVDHVEYFVKTLATNPVELDLGVESALPTFFTETQKLKALQIFADTFQYLFDKAHIVLDEINYAPDLGKNVLNKIKLKYFGALDAEKEAQKVRGEAIEYVIHTLEKSRSMRVITDLSNGEVDFIAQYVRGFFAQKERFEHWELEVLNRIHQSCGKCIKFTAQNLAYDYLLALQNQREINPQDRELYEDTTSRSIPKLNLVRRNANRYLLQYAFLTKNEELLGLVRDDFFELETGRSLYSPDEDAVLTCLMEASETDNVELFRTKAIEYLAVRESIEKRMTRKKEYFHYNRFVVQGRNLDASVYGYRFKNEYTMPQQVVEDPVSYDSDKAVRIVLPFGRKVITKLLDLLPQAKWLDSIRERLKVA